MKPPSLFPSNLPPSPHPGEPAVWVKRLVIVRERAAGQVPLRNIEFRLGLNIVGTQEEAVGDAATAGHNVGKTLLVRLIRYCLGDTHYGSGNVRDRVRRCLPDGWVVGVFRVAATTWAVARPLGPGGAGWCAATEAYEDVLRDAAGLRPYSDFQQAVAGLVPPGLANVRLDEHDRCPGWTDLLGWLIRDQRCRYTHHNAWRHLDAEAGPGVLTLGEANLVTRLTMGLFDAEEYRQTLRLTELRAEITRLEADRDRRRHVAAQSRARLLLVAPVDGDAPEGPLFPGLRERIESNRAVQEARLRDPAIRQELDLAEQCIVRRRTQADRTAGRLEELARRRDLVAAQLQSASRPSEAEALARHSHIIGCGHAECLWLKKPPEPLPDPTRTDRIREYTGDLEQLDREIISTRAVHDQEEAEVREAEAQRSQALGMFEATVAGIRRGIARYEVMAEQLTEHEAVVGQAEEVEGRLRILQGQMAEAERLRARRSGSRNREMAELNTVYRHVTTALLRRASGELVLNLHVGLAPRPDEATGEAFGTAGKVIGFDLACLVAGMCGQGRHPRFLVHDSPREADMHQSIYDNLFRFALALESHFPGLPPAFQYIITTTTPPPHEVAVPLHIRETLNAASAEGLLLQGEF